MSNFKPKDILPKVLTGRSRKTEDAPDYLSVGFERYFLGPKFQMSPGSVCDDSDDSDGSSIASLSSNQTHDDPPEMGRTPAKGSKKIGNLAHKVTTLSITIEASGKDENIGLNTSCSSSRMSFSTNATTDNLPGTGRTLDTYLYQPAGKWVENLAQRLATRLSDVHAGNENVDNGSIFTSQSVYSYATQPDLISVPSFSTMATADDLPGTGRVIDSFFYQPVGRWIENIALRNVIPSFSPAAIAQFIEAENTDFEPSFSTLMTLSSAIAKLHERKKGSAMFAGIKSLVKQTQSNSIDRSAQALAALIRVSIIKGHRELFVNVSCIEHIFNLETLAGSLQFEPLLRKYSILLAKLARETLIAVKDPSVRYAFDPDLKKSVLRLCPSPETALDLRGRLIHALQSYRSSGVDSLDVILGDVCAICAKAISTCIHYCARGGAYIHALETVYFAVVFIIQSVPQLEVHPTLVKYISLVLQTLSYWIDAIVYRCLFSVISHQKRFDMDQLEAGIAFRCLVIACNSISHVFLPESFAFINQNLLIEKEVLPRRSAATVDWRDERIVLRLYEASERRAFRLLRSFDELEREAWGGPSEIYSSSPKSILEADPLWFSPHDFGQACWDIWEKKLDKARGARVPENELTEEFREARRIGMERDPSSDPKDKSQDVEYDVRNWGHYELRRISRHKWGQYLRSNMDWDWDLGTCMRRLFKVTRQTRLASQISTTSSVASDIDVCQGGIWKISIGEAREGMPKEVQIAYKTEDGKTQYLSLVPVIPTPGHHPISIISSSGSSTEEILDPTVVQQDLRCRKGSSGGEQEIEDL